MKRTILAFALSVLLIAALAACSSRPSNNAGGSGSTNNGTSNNGNSGSNNSGNGSSNGGSSNGGSSNGGSSSPRPNTNSSGVGGGSGSAAGSVVPDDGTPDDVIVDGEVVGGETVDVDPVYHGARTHTVSHHTWEYCADCNGNVIDFGDEATIGDNARRMVNSVTNGMRRVGNMVGDMAYDMTHM